MEGRTENRKSRRVQIHFWPRGIDTGCVGFGTNISSTGMFAATNSPLLTGSLKRRVEELVAELFPEVASKQRSGAAGDLPEGTSSLRFPTRSDFLVAYRRDIAIGGLVVPRDAERPRASYSDVSAGRGTAKVPVAWATGSV